jgi:CRISPR/Cas system CSM-associated protein Csm3 (group 7 of RAMP superfamily)
MHLCNDPQCYLCTIFGRNNAKQTPILKNMQQFEIECTTPTRLIVRDGQLDKDSLKGAQTDLPFTEIKWEVGIDRITSAANPRQMERVPAGAEFDFEMVYTIYNPQDRANLKRVFEAMQLLEHDYLGGQGSRGSGQIEFAQLKVGWYPKSFYETGNVSLVVPAINGEHTNVKGVLENFGQVQQRVVWNAQPADNAEAASSPAQHTASSESAPDTSNDASATETDTSQTE